jgi:hypothetical protein
MTIFGSASATHDLVRGNRIASIRGEARQAFTSRRRLSKIGGPPDKVTSAEIPGSEAVHCPVTMSR